jgi:hypothetical protein
MLPFGFPNKITKPEIRNLRHPILNEYIGCLEIPMYDPIRGNNPKPIDNLPEDPNSLFLLKPPYITLNHYLWP